MGENTAISWADHTFNPWMGCTKVSPGCKNCYAETMAKNRMGLNLWGPKAERRVTKTAYWRRPLMWNRKAKQAGVRPRVFCGSMCDVFEKHPTTYATLPALWDLIRATPALDWLMLTKRPENLEECLPLDWGEGYPNVWLGVSVESMEYVWRAEVLKEFPAVVSFISYEPALDALPINLHGIDWVIYGGESGPGHRRDDVEWARGIRDNCRSHGVAFFMKQRSGARPGMGAELDGEVIQELPRPRVVGAQG